jgi:YVTN family beta-propeller protein
MIGTMRLVRALILVTFTLGASGGASFLLPTAQRIAPNDDSLAFFGRPSDLALSPDRRVLGIKTSHGLVFVDARSWRILQALPLPKLPIDYPEHLGGSAPAGILWNADGSQVWTTDAYAWIHGARISADGTFRWVDRIALPSLRAPPAVSAPIGMAWDAAHRVIFVAISRDNAVAAVDVRSHRILYRVAVGNAPYGVSRVGNKLYVSNWAGRPSSGARSVADSSGTLIRVDPVTGSASSGTVSVVDLNTHLRIADIDVGLHPNAMVAADDGKRLYVANSNSDSVGVIETARDTLLTTIALSAGETFGRTPTALAISPDGKALYVAEAGTNDVATIDTASGKIRGRTATGWYPAGLEVGIDALYVADLKGAGSRAKDFGLALPPATIAQRGGARGYNVYDYAGLAERLPLSSAGAASGDAFDASEPGEAVRLRGMFKHVLYIIAENHTYDDYFGDVKAGNGDASLCAFCAVTPNHHALAARFGLFDNTYVNGILSADGHNWTDEGYATDYVERSLSGWARSYPSAGNDALAYSPAGFIWNRVLARGLTFRDYGEFIPDVSAFTPATATWSDLYADYVHGTHRVTWLQDVQIASLRPYVNLEYPSFSLRISDQYRASVFLADLKRFERVGRMPNLLLMALGNDHTSGTDPGRPKPRAYAADHDLALGRIVAAFSRSRFWRDSVIFVIEDDAQDGLDHVDGHRTMALAISPRNVPGRVYHQFYDQTSILHTIELIFGLSPLTRFDANAPPIVAPFGSGLDLRPFNALPNLIPLDRLNPSLASVRPLVKGRDLEDGASMARLIRL